MKRKDEAELVRLSWSVLVVRQKEGLSQRTGRVSERKEKGANKQRHTTRIIGYNESEWKRRYHGMSPSVVASFDSTLLGRRSRHGQLQFGQNGVNGRSFPEKAQRAWQGHSRLGTRICRARRARIVIAVDSDFRQVSVFRSGTSVNTEMSPHVEDMRRTFHSSCSRAHNSVTGAQAFCTWAPAFLTWRYRTTDVKRRLGRTV